MMYRAAFVYEFDGLTGFEWVCVKCWNVADEWASRAVDIDRRYRVKRLRLLSPNPVPVGVCNPRVVLGAYLDSLPIEVKDERSAEAFAV